MLKVGNKDPSSIHIGTREIKKVFFRNNKIYPITTIFLNITPNEIWLTQENNNIDVVNVSSNTDWEVN